VARRYVCSRNLENEEAKTVYRAVKIQSQWVVTAGKQTATNNVLCILIRLPLGTGSSCLQSFFVCNSFRPFREIVREVLHRNMNYYNHSYLQNPARC